MKKTMASFTCALLLAAAIAAGFQAGRSVGFETGSEWALVQAEIVAREAGLFMPVYMEGDNFRVVLKQRPGVYKKAWKQADRYEEAGETLRTARVEGITKQGEINNGI